MFGLKNPPEDTGLPLPFKGERLKSKFKIIRSAQSGKKIAINVDKITNVECRSDYTRETGIAIYLVDIASPIHPVIPDKYTIEEGFMEFINFLNHPFKLEW